MLQLCPILDVKLGFRRFKLREKDIDPGASSSIRESFRKTTEGI
jgi:hypothetical protein